MRNAGESHETALIRLLGKDKASALDPASAGWVRQAGDAIQTGDLREPGNLAAFNLAAREAKTGAPIMIDHPGGAVEVPASMGPMFFDNPGSFVKLPPASPALLSRIAAAARKTARAGITAHQ